MALSYSTACLKILDWMFRFLSHFYSKCSRKWFFYKLWNRHSNYSLINCAYVGQDPRLKLSAETGWPTKSHTQLAVWQTHKVNTTSWSTVTVETMSAMLCSSRALIKDVANPMVVVTVPVSSSPATMAWSLMSVTPTTWVSSPMSLFPPALGSSSNTSWLRTNTEGTNDLLLWIFVWCLLFRAYIYSYYDVADDALGIKLHTFIFVIVSLDVQLPSVMLFFSLWVKF